MALTAAQTAQKELDTAVADLEKKKALRSRCLDKAKAAHTALEQAREAAKKADAEVSEQTAICDWLSAHLLLKAAEETEIAPVAEEPVVAEETEVEGQTTVEEQIAEVSTGNVTPEAVEATPGATVIEEPAPIVVPASLQGTKTAAAVDDLFATA